MWAAYAIGRSQLCDWRESRAGPALVQPHGDATKVSYNQNSSSIPMLVGMAGFLIYIYLTFRMTRLVSEDFLVWKAVRFK